MFLHALRSIDLRSSYRVRHAAALVFCVHYSLCTVAHWPHFLLYCIGTNTRIPNCISHTHTHALSASYIFWWGYVTIHRSYTYIHIYIESTHRGVTFRRKSTRYCYRTISLYIRFTYTSYLYIHATRTQFATPYGMVLVLLPQLREHYCSHCVFTMLAVCVCCFVCMTMMVFERTFSGVCRV